MIICVCLDPYLFYLLGGEDGDRHRRKEIYELVDGTWTQVNMMQEWRDYHAVSVVNVDKYLQFCI